LLFDLADITSLGSRIVASQAVPTPDAGPSSLSLYVWTTTDGDAWQGGLMAENLRSVGPVLATTGPHRWAVISSMTAGGELVVFRQSATDTTWSSAAVEGLTPNDGGPGQWTAQLVAVSADRDGRMTGVVRTAGTNPPSLGYRVALDAQGSWSATPCEYGLPGCVAPSAQSGRLVVAGSTSSTDYGATWQPVSLETRRQRIDDLVWASIDATRSGGWVGTASAETVEGPTGLLLTSPDGVHWKQVDPRRLCQSRHAPRGFSRPVSDRHRWYAAADCAAEDGVETVVLQSSDGSASQWKIVDVTRAGEHAGPPVLAGRVSIPVYDASGALKRVRAP
jgi:hypothetical protein